ncbi:E3 ubiquitin-protein ligase ZNF598 isoform X2 [Nomia melanderi]|nr:E3 ubiquitin-protein ligase ZNF598 isoform X2 [Nomia melanderi]
MDNDELFRHLRRDHLYCHFCDADGLHQYYSSYDYLRDHFRQEHYLCEEGLCSEEKFTSVFRTDIDLKAHKANVHSKQLSKAAAKQARTLELEFTLAPRGDNRMNRRGMLGASTSRNSRDYGGRDYNLREYQQTVMPNSSNVFVTNNEPTFVRQPSVDVQSTEEFPTLGNATPVVPTLNQAKGRGNVTIRSTIRPQPLAVTDENFPALGLESAGISKTVNFSVSSGNTLGSGAQPQKGTTSNVSIQVNHEANGTVTTKVSGPNIRIRPAKLSMESDFPALGTSEPSASNNNSAQWKEVLQWTCSKSASTSVPKPKKVASPPLVPSPPPIQSGEDFPILSKSSKSKKQSTITVVPSWGQPQSSNNSNNVKTTTDLTKGKAKKKKVKQNSSTNSNDISSSKTNVNTVVVKKESETAKTSKNPCSIDTVNAIQSSSQSAQSTDNVANTENSSKNINVQQSKEVEHANKKEKKKHKNSDNQTIVNTNNDNSTSNGVQRKRTELKIDSLNSTNRNARHLEDFPALGTSSSMPPGFTNPPPGFGTTTPPPPGFCIKYNSMDKINNSNGLTFTNSSGESYSILPNDKHNSAYNYVPSPDFQKRNKCLVAKVNEVLMQQDQIEEFRYISGLFRQGMCNAQDYYTHCREVMGLSAFESVFLELLVLLPDIAKQQELFKVHEKESGNKIEGLEICATCNQVLKSGSDFRTHMTSHTLENHFPALGKSSVQLQKNSWVRK